MDDAELARHGARRRVAQEQPGYPCRVSLEDAEVGATLILLPFEHHPVDTPYRASGPIYVREGATQANPAVNEVPGQLRRRQLSVRAYSARGMMRDAAVVEGTDLETAITRLFEDPKVAYLHLHNAKPGCYAARVDRA
ncbi:MAG: DUF1203 domain-containing protein [Holophagaceae bacterium]|nr:DUF1203 domain-containing protein [Holophagaceae bacterium]